jgi:hypothetical protein
MISGIKYVRCHFELFPGRSSCENPPEIQFWACFRVRLNSVSHARFLNRFFQYTTCKCAPILTRWLVRNAQATFQLTMLAVDSLMVKDIRGKLNTEALHLSGLIWTVSLPEMQKIRITGFFFENCLYGLFEVRLLIFRECTCVKTF